MRLTLCRTFLVVALIVSWNSSASATSTFSSDFIAVTQLNATDYVFTQGGFLGGGAVTGVFSGLDLDLNGQLSSFGGEIFDFGMTFSGNGLVSPFSLNFFDLFGLVYDLDGGPLGDGVDGDIEGIGAFGFDAEYFAGPGLVNLCGQAQPCAVVTSAVPEDSSLFLCLSGLASLAGVSRFTKREVTVR